MSWFVVDCESDGPIPFKNSMVCFGAVPVANLAESFYGTTKPISKVWNPEALAISGFTRQQHEAFDDPAVTMLKFVDWIEATSKGRPVFVSDNLAYDWQWINWYCHYFVGKNPFGFSGRRIGDLYAGLKGDAGTASDWKKLRRTSHTHNPVDDARGNAEALVAIAGMGLKVRF
jgi:hypothetical protein